jgi:HAD superfamily hydrolase (TIGR01509 family)
MYQHILFDFDGTIAHSQDALFATINETLQIHQKSPLEHKLINKYLGKKAYDLYFDYSDSDHETAAKMRQTHIDIQHKHFDKYCLYPGVIKTLQSLSKIGIKLAIVSTANRSKLDRLIDKLGIKIFFQIIITADDVKLVKPAREPFALALRLMTAERKTSLMIGDSDADIIGARSFGIDSVGVNYGHYGKAISEFDPTYTVDKFEDILQIITK